MARIDVPMPQMGESIAEGTVAKWMKKVGDEVARDEALLEISTDKVDAEIPSPAAGTLAEILVQEGSTVEVGTIVATIETEKGAVAAPPSAGGGGVAAKAAPTKAPAAKPDRERATSVAPVAEFSEPQPAASPAAEGDGRAETDEERLRRRSTPLVRRIAAEHGVDIGDVTGTGHAGRVTKQDIMQFIEQRATVAEPAPRERPAAAAMDVDDVWSAFFGQVRHPEFPARPGDRVQPMDRIRRLTADHMVRAKRIAPHVHSFIEIDFTQIDRIRSAARARWDEQGVKVSYTAFVAWAVARVLPEFPMVNGTVSGENLIFRGDINLGIAVDLNPGLIVPVVKKADELNLVGLARRITDLAQRARDSKLKPDEIQGATFSITNPGVLGTMVGMPIIPEGTSAILGTGSIEKRPVVIEVDGTDVIGIRKRTYFSLGYDHRIVDGADAARFLSRLKDVLEQFPSDGI
ncbi:MAG: 2-oxo acid dehydrogenase subunit E2 [Gemmatimonadetes bacterium]|nr:2-oxo acid dehydrogenase subunit E2 [Gemmatimonadota bacterium]